MGIVYGNDLGKPQLFSNPDANRRALKTKTLPGIGLMLSSPGSQF
jgi:hypothetical protein